MRGFDLTGQTFGRLTVLRFSGSKEYAGKTRRHWICLCSCGTEKELQTDVLREGAVMSCGCLAIERIGALRRTHGETKCREYRAWAHAKERCFNPRMKKYKNWGGRGIIMCDRWKNSYENFVADMGRCPVQHSLDRIDNDGNYEPGNCRWATPSQQSRNQRSNLPINLHAIAAAKGISYKLAWARMKRGTL